MFKYDNILSIGKIIEVYKNILYIKKLVLFEPVFSFNVFFPLSSVVVYW